MFESPVDMKNLLRNKKKIKDELLVKAQLKIKIAIISGSTIAELKDYLQLFLLKHGIDCEFWETPYNSYYEEVMFGNGLDEFNPDWVYIHTNHRNIIDVNQCDEEKERWLSIYSKLSNKKYKVILNNFDYPEYRLLGNYDAISSDGKVNLITEINSMLVKSIKNNDNLFLNDINYLSSMLGFERWYNDKYWYAFKYAVSSEAMGVISRSVASIISSTMNITKKVLVCDLDNTLWGGVIGDDGVDNIKIGSDCGPKGEMFKDVQYYVKSLSSRGVILAINSKNDIANAKSGFTHPNSILCTSDFSAVQATWNRKSENMTSLSKDLNLYTDSFVFIDDNKSEIDEVLSEYPNIDSVSYSTCPSELMKQIDRMGYFEVTGLTCDDQKRSEYYRANKKRDIERKNVGSLDDFLSGLDMKVNFSSLDENNFERSHQLINKTNQFNVNTVRLTELKIKDYMVAGHSSIITELSDKYGTNGNVSVLLSTFLDCEASIDFWVMSCRVFNRHLEFAIMDEFVKQCLYNGIMKINATYKRTPKNKYIDDLYDRLGFSLLTEGQEEKSYVLLVHEYANKNKNMKVNCNE